MLPAGRGETCEPSGRTDADRRVVNYVLEHHRTFGFAPTLREIQSACGFRSVSTARAAVGRLECAGVIVNTHGQARGLTVVDPVAPALRRSAEEQGLAILELFAVMEMGYYPYVCEAAALAPDLASAQDWLELAIARVRQLSAIQDALLRARSTMSPLHQEACARDAAVVWTGLRAHCESLSTWAGWLALERFECELILARRFPTCDLPAVGVPAMALEGNLDTARLGLAVVHRALARVGARRDDFAAELDAETGRAELVYESLREPLDRIWPDPAGGRPDDD